MKSLFHLISKCNFVLLSIIIVTLFIIISSCGGGFQEDSDNADEFINPIFSSDTTN